MKTIRLAAILLALALPAAAAEAPAKGTASWEKLKSLAGEWTGATTTVTYRVVSNGTALMETINSPEHAQMMITMYHPDGDSLLMTHYCSMGNQPRMRATGLENGKLDFRYVDASNLKSPDAPRMSHLVINFVDADHVVNEWTYKDGAKEQTEKFALTRKK